MTRLLHDEAIVQGEAAIVSYVSFKAQTQYTGLSRHSQTVKFLIAEQKFLEHLEARDTKKALSVLRNELALLNHDSERLHQLSRYVDNAFYPAKQLNPPWEKLHDVCWSC